MPPTSTPQPNEIESVREIAQLYSFAQAENFINGTGDGINNGLNEVQWLATLADIAEWSKVKNKHTQIKGDGVDINKERNRLDITIRVRRRLGIVPADPNGDLGSAGGCYVSYTPEPDDSETFNCFE